MRKLFGTDGVRGIANLEPMTSETAMQLGRAAAHIFKRRAGPRWNALLAAGLVVQADALPTAAVSDAFYRRPHGRSRNEAPGCGRTPGADHQLAGRILNEAMATSDTHRGRPYPGDCEARKLRVRPKRL